MGQATTATRSEAVAAWTLHYEADTAKALDRIQHMRQHGIPDGHHGEWLGACLALTPREDRCAHWGDRKNCTQCLSEQIEAEDTERRERKRQAATEARLRREAEQARQSRRAA
jgi:hypothetical protein